MASAKQPTMTAINQAPPSWLIYGGKGYTANINFTSVTATNTDGIKIIYSGTVMTNTTGVATFERLADISAASTFSGQRTGILLNDTLETDGAGAILFDLEGRLGILDTINADLITNFTALTTLTDLTPVLPTAKYGLKFTLV